MFHRCRAAPSGLVDLLDLPVGCPPFLVQTLLPGAVVSDGQGRVRVVGLGGVPSLFVECRVLIVSLYGVRKSRLGWQHVDLIELVVWELPTRCPVQRRCRGLRTES